MGVNAQCELLNEYLLLKCNLHLTSGWNASIRTLKHKSCREKAPVKVILGKGEVRGQVLPLRNFCQAMRP